MRSATDITLSTRSVLLRTGLRRLVDHQRTPSSTAMRRRSCGLIVATDRTKRWTNERLRVLIRRWWMLGLTEMGGSEGRCTITSRGQPRRRWLVITTQPTMCRTLCTSRSGPGTVSLVLSLRSRRKYKAWGASPRIKDKIVFKPAHAGDRPIVAQV